MKILALMTVSALALSAAANADVSISSKPTSNMSCDAGVCTATAKNAVLNVDDLQTMLASGDAAVKTSTLANDIEINQPLTWSSTSRLTLDARRSVIVNKRVTVSGTGGLTVTTNDNGGKRSKSGDLVIVLQHGGVQFWDLASSLIIDGNSYTLVGDIKTLASDIAAKPSGLYALAKPYDASADGTYSDSPVRTEFGGTFEGLGNTIDGLHVSHKHLLTGLFAEISSGGKVRDLGLTHANVAGTSSNVHYQDDTGALAGYNGGTIHSCYATGLVRARAGDVGSLVGWNDNSIDGSWANVSVKGGYSAGGLVGFNEGGIADSYATGAVIGSYSSSGGLVGWNNRGMLESSYSTSLVSGSGMIGGVIGYDESGAGNLAADYWDLDTSAVADPAQGAGNIPNEPGLTGLSDAQLKSGLPDSFDPKIWASNPKINSGYPYLLANPPK